MRERKDDETARIVVYPSFLMQTDGVLSFMSRRLIASARLIAYPSRKMHQP